MAKRSEDQKAKAQASRERNEARLAAQQRFNDRAERAAYEAFGRYIRLREDPVISDGVFFDAYREGYKAGYLALERNYTVRSLSWSGYCKDPSDAEDPTQDKE